VGDSKVQRVVVVVFVVFVLAVAHVGVLRKPMIPTCLYRPRGLSLN